MVLGDVGRSPRMQYHALALADHVADVDLVGYGGCALPHAVHAHPRIRLHLLRPSRRRQLPRPVFLWGAAWRALRQSVQLLVTVLFVLRRPDVVLVQNPPAVPTLLVALIAARLRSAKLVIDWHNWAYTMLALRLGPRHPAVRLARWYEGAAGRHADAHLCVSRAMQAALAQSWRIGNATVLYDRPAAFFTPTPAPVRRDLFQRLRNEIAWPGGYRPDAPERPAIIVSPTSWTADEDFSVLLDAVTRCDERIRRHEQEPGGRPFPHLLFLITGQGPLRAHYEGQIARLTLTKIRLCTLWLSPEEYALLLGAADAGLCLHRSSSGLDLPMKLADMFGAGLPVCALDYGPCLRERLHHGEGGLIFASAAELATQLCELFNGFPESTPLLDRLRHNVAAAARTRWSEEWKAQAQPVFSKLWTLG